MREKADWLKIRNEYINGNTSYRKLAEKYGISFNTLKDVAVKNNWYQDKIEQHNNITTELQQKTAEIIVDAEVSRVKSMLELTDKAQATIDEALSQLKRYSVGDAVVELELIDVDRLKKIVSAIKDIKDILKEEKTVEDNVTEDKTISIIFEPVTVENIKGIE